MIQSSLRDLPTDIAPNVVADSEAFWPSYAQQPRPDQLDKLAVQLAMRSTPTEDSPTRTAPVNGASPGPVVSVPTA